ncbi:CDP-alcohol phosphatidyltransferase family protein [Allosediminivita pacifica]|uniref:Phosphatidylglycerophosphate synthase n=1 Tax=Allosediminivita pacifica TaxID=1267769 RepID=A0A2T6ABC4_9RHOB|nr:CDP-alcohol phosphatidyltransferase family protein [Allosediminivita pacifica]PTX41109.1 phosphatidylglycerophosphate synthase [Allosediminivita pacifica]GGB25076.1 hypothetical protein GCM10011324_38790 [Allosediminivita pacifica]
MRVPIPLSSAPAGDTPARRLALFGLGTAPCVSLLAWLISPSGLPLALAILTAGFALAARGMAADYPHRLLGACNLVTATRLAITAALAASLAGITDDTWDWAVPALALTALALDGIDGWLARRQGLRSDFGARFDMEVDSGLAAILALSALAEGRAGAELLILGGARYAFAAAALALPWLAAPLPESLGRKTVCVLQIAALVALSIPVLPAEAARPLALAAAALLTWSFARDIRWLRGRA